MRIGTTLLERTRQVMEVEGLTVSDEQPLAVAVQKDGVRAEVEICALDRLGIAFQRLRLWGNGAQADLDALAEAIAERVTYLPERLAPIERDPQRGIVQMRSAPPFVEDGDVEYFELTLSRTGEETRLHLMRHRRPEGRRRREGVSIVLTQPLFQRLVDDLATLLRHRDETD